MQKTISFSVLMCLPVLMFAHGSHGSGIMAGFTHPILGVDHNVAILGSAILGYWLDQKKWYFYPLAFILAMILGGLIGIGEEATVLIEKIIAFSVFAIGLILAFRVNLSLFLALIVLAVFGYFHGYAHGAEMPETNTALKYISGYTLGALLLAFVWMMISRWVYGREEAPRYYAVLGGIMLGCGMMMLLS